MRVADDVLHELRISEAGKVSADSVIIGTEARPGFHLGSVGSVESTVEAMERLSSSRWACVMVHLVLLVDFCVSCDRFATETG